MRTGTTDIEPAQSAVVGVMGAIVGLGVVTMAIFPFLIPGLAVLALFAVPLIPVVIAGALVGGLVWAISASARGLRRVVGRRTGARRARSTEPASQGSGSPRSSLVRP